MPNKAQYCSIPFYNVTEFNIKTLNSRNIFFTFSTLEGLVDDAVKLSVRPPLNTDSTFRLDSPKKVFIEFRLRPL